jgi:hypothetical protein
MKATLLVPDLLPHDTIHLGLATDLLGEVLDFHGIANKTTPLLRNDVLSVVLQLKQVLGHIRPCTPSHYGSEPERHCPPHPCEPSTLGQSGPE